jgi:hypothetical protein
VSVPAWVLAHKGSDYEDAAMLVSFTFESIGIMVHRRMVTIDIVWELMGGVLKYGLANITSLGFTTKKKSS